MPIIGIILVCLLGAIAMLLLILGVSNDLRKARFRPHVTALDAIRVKPFKVIPLSEMLPDSEMLPQARRKLIMMRILKIASTRSKKLIRTELIAVIALFFAIAAYSGRPRDHERCEDKKAEEIKQLRTLVNELQTRLDRLEKPQPADTPSPLIPKTSTPAASVPVESVATQLHHRQAPPKLPNPESGAIRIRRLDLAHRPATHKNAGV